MKSLNNYKHGQKIRIKTEQKIKELFKQLLPEQVGFAPNYLSWTPGITKDMRELVLGKEVTIVGFGDYNLIVSYMQRGYINSCFIAPAWIEDDIIKQLDHDILFQGLDI